MISISYIKKLYEDFYAQSKLNKDYAIIFVYNSPKNADEMHKTECIYPIEHEMIFNSFCKVAQYVYSYSSEDEFISEVNRLKIRHEYLLVYSMAQNISGIGRRTLIPLICRYYNLINIGSNEYASFLSGNKKLMHELLSRNHDLYFPKTIYINNSTPSQLENIVKSIHTGIYMIKPIDESASIGVKMLNFNDYNLGDLVNELYAYNQIYSSFCLQEYISGTEIEVPLVMINNDYFCPGICQILFECNSQYLDYDTVGVDAYDFTFYSKNTSKIITNAVSAVRQLNFDVISRVDYRIHNGTPYIIDIGANPTVSTHSTTNFLFKRLFDDESSIYHLLVIRALIQNGLFKPSLY